MSVRTSARQYANALFDVARRTGRTDQIGRDFAEFVALVRSHDDLRLALEERAVPPAAKAAILRTLFERGGDLAPELQRLLLWLAERDRLVLLADIHTAYAASVLDASHVVTAEITSPVALGETARGSLRQALAAAVGREVIMTERVDDAIIGGIVAKVGSVVYDGSVTRQLERLREQLLAEL